MKMKWNKLASVTRARKWFYTAKFGGARYMVRQSWLTGLWNAEADGAVLFEFRTAKEAMRAIENHAGA